MVNPVFQRRKKFLRLILIGLAFCAGCAPAAAGKPAPATPLPTIASTSDTSSDKEVPYPIATPVPALGDTVAGTVISGGDLNLSGLQDAPRTFIYQVRLADGSQVAVQYTAYPPSPAADRHPITLDFYAGQIQAGDYLEAKGAFDPVTGTLIVSEEGDYIRTFAADPNNPYP